MKPRFAEKTSSRGRKPRSAGPSLKSGEGKKLESSVTINRSPQELYSFWRRFENLPRFMTHIESVTQKGDNLWHWVVKTSKGKELEWDSRIIEDKPNQMISWQSLDDADMDNAGSVWFTPAADGRGTVVKVAMKYSPPGGKVGAWLATISGDRAEQNFAEELLRFKSLMETGAVSTTERVEPSRSLRK
jgi:uncharacterized membrane protein